MVHDGFVFGCIGDSAALSSTEAMSMLGRVKSLFLDSYTAKVRDKGKEKEGIFRPFNTELKSTLNRFNHINSSSVASVQSQIDDTKAIMVANIEKVMDRGENLDAIHEKSESMKIHALQFRNKGRKLRKHLWWQNTKMKIAIGVGVLVLGFVIFLAACRGFKCVS